MRASQVKVNERAGAASLSSTGLSQV
jgi:hypothetical protein